MFSGGMMFDDDEKGDLNDKLKNSSNEALPWIFFHVGATYEIKVWMEKCLLDWRR